ncbi:MAG: hypothetical protein M3P18_16820 [Actinomycetota bacterium]|nr:hypothetical protein [Actinomycetota bacterium]
MTRGLKVWLPPELYLQEELATRESMRWRSTLRLPATPREFSSKVRCRHLIATMFPEPWRACPVRVGVTWSVRSYPRLKTELMAADEQEAADWLNRRTPKGIDVEAQDQVEFLRRGVLASAGIFRVKRVMGF